MLFQLVQTFHRHPPAVNIDSIGRVGNIFNKNPCNNSKKSNRQIVFPKYQQDLGDIDDFSNLPQLSRYTAVGFFDCPQLSIVGVLPRHAAFGYYRTTGGGAIRYQAPWSALLVSITTFTVLLMVACFIGLPVTLIVESFPDALLPASLTLLATVAFFIWIVRTQFIRCYRLDGNKLVIERFGPDTSFALARLKSVEVDPDAMKRTWAMTNGGLFAFAGRRCRNGKLGTYEAYATNHKNSVVLRFPDNILVVTPEQPDAFARAVTSRTRITQSQVGAPSRERS